MKSLTKRDLILQAIIEAYLEENLPIGSSELQLRIPMDISASTIRVYFKQLSNDGDLTQLHISGGRIPTDKAMKDFWARKLSLFPVIHIHNTLLVQELAYKFGIYCLINRSLEVTLEDIINVSKRYLLLIFNNFEIVLTYSLELELFLKSFLGISLSALKEVAVHVGLHELKDKIDMILKGAILLNEGEATMQEMVKFSGEYEKIRYLKDPYFMNNLKDGIYFEDIVSSGYMLVKNKAISPHGEDMHFICMGKLETNFEEFFYQTKEGR